MLTDYLSLKGLLEEGTAHSIPYTSASSLKVICTSFSGEDNKHRASVPPGQRSHPNLSQLDKYEPLTTISRSKSLPDLPKDPSHAPDAFNLGAFRDLEPGCYKENLNKVKNFDCCIM